MRIILASASPRRKEILSKLGVDFEIIVSNADENINESNPEILVERLSEIKAKKILQKAGSNGTLILAADTVVVLEDKVLGKPSSKEDAYFMLSSLSGKRHSVHTGVSVIFNGKIETTHDTTDVFFREILDEEIKQYIETDEPYDKAGSYAIQGIAGKFIDKIEGSFSNVMGLPEETVRKIFINHKIIEK